MGEATISFSTSDSKPRFELLLNSLSETGWEIDFNNHSQHTNIYGARMKDLLVPGPVAASGFVTRGLSTATFSTTADCQSPNGGRESTSRTPRSILSLWAVMV